MGPLASQTWDRRTRRPQPQSRVCTLEDSPHSLPDSTSNASAVALQQTTQLSLQKRHEVNTRLAARDAYDGRSGEQGLATGSERTSR